MYLHSLIHIEQSIASLYENYSEALPTPAQAPLLSRDALFTAGLHVVLPASLTKTLKLTAMWI